MGPNDNFFDYFVLCMHAMISNALPKYTKIASYGKQTTVDSECPTRIMDVFSIRFRDGNIVELTPVPISRTVAIFFSLSDGSFPDGADFSTRLDYDMVMLTPPPCINDYHIWPKGTWLYELADIIVTILNWGEAGRLSELISSLKNNCGTVTHFPITPPAEQPKSAEESYYKNLKGFTF